MGRKLFVGGLPYATSEEELANAFRPHGTVESARIMTDRETGRSRGFGFVEMATDAEAQAAISALDGSPFGGRTLAVKEARPRPPRQAAFAPFPDDGGHRGGRFGDRAGGRGGRRPRRNDRGRW